MGRSFLSMAIQAARAGELLKEHAGIDAKIEVPEDWVDARLDGGANA